MHRGGIRSTPGASPPDRQRPHPNAGMATPIRPTMVRSAPTGILQPLRPQQRHQCPCGGKKCRFNNSGLTPTAQWGTYAQPLAMTNPCNRPAFSNTLKTYLNLWYCFSCGYDVDHNGYNCPNPKLNHIPNVHCDHVHTIEGTCMKAVNKTLPDGTGAGKGWILTQAMKKHQHAMPQSQNPWCPRGNGSGRGRGYGGGRGWANY